MSLHIELGEHPLTTYPSESENRLQAIGYTPNDKDFLIALSVFLTINDIVNHTMGQLRRKSRPSLWLDVASHRTEIVVRIRSRKLHRIVEMTRLEGRISGKLAIKLQEAGV